MRFIETLKNIWTIEELRKRLLITVLLVFIYRVGCYVVLPGISPSDIDALASFTNKSGLMQLVDMFSAAPSRKPPSSPWVSCPTLLRRL